MTGRPTQPQTFLMHSKKATTANSDMASQEIHMLRFGPAEHPHAHNTCAPVSRPAQSLAYESPAVPYTMGLRQTLVCSVSRRHVLPHAPDVRSGVTRLAKPCLRAPGCVPSRSRIAKKTSSSRTRSARCGTSIRNRTTTTATTFLPPLLAGEGQGGGVQKKYCVVPDSIRDPASFDSGHKPNELTNQLTN